MNRKQIVLVLSFLMMHSSWARAQTAPVAAPEAPPSVDQDITPESMDVGNPDMLGDSDPLDVLEPKSAAPVEEPTVPQFTEIPEPGAEGVPQAESAPEEIPEPTIEPPATEIAAPEPTPETVPAPEVNPPSEVSSQAGGDPDWRKEKKFHDVYKKYNEQPTSQEAWDSVVGNRRSENYKVQKGDTLWELSQTLFGDANYWPKVWSYNVGQIGNPHEIDPQMMIRFYPGTADEAPTLGLGLASNELVDQNTESVVSRPPAVTRPAKKHTPVLRNLPESLPVYRLGSVSKPPVMMELPASPRKFAYAPEYMGYYVANQSPEGVGVLRETELGMSSASDYQYVIVGLESAASTGKTFTVVQEIHGVKGKHFWSRNAHVIEVQGEIEIVEKVNERDNLYRALVRKTIQPLMVGAKLMPTSLPMFDPTPTEVTATTQGAIIGGALDSERKQLNNNMIVFINVGSSQGVREGQSFNIYSDIRKRNPGSRAQVNDRVSGTLKVIRVADNFATAYVTSAKDDIFVGDSIGARNSVANLDAPALERNTDMESSPDTDLLAPTVDGNPDFEM